MKLKLLAILFFALYFSFEAVAQTIIEKGKDNIPAVRPAQNAREALLHSGGNTIPVIYIYGSNAEKYAYALIPMFAGENLPEGVSLTHPTGAVIFYKELSAEHAAQGRTGTIVRVYIDGEFVDFTGEDADKYEKDGTFTVNSLVYALPKITNLMAETNAFFGRNISN